MTKGRILIGKAGLDGHDRGAKYVAHLLRDAGYDVIYTGIRRTAEQIVDAAIREDVDAIGLSVLSGAHKFVFGRVLNLLRERHAGHIPVVGGGTIPAKDVALLKQWGVREIFTPGTPAGTILSAFDTLLKERQHACGCHA